MLRFYYHFVTADRFFRRSVFWERARIVEYQNAILKHVIYCAGKNVPYYKDLFKKYKIDCEDFKGINDMQQIPPLNKEDIRRDPEKFCAVDYKKYGGRWRKTSGSTGTPLKIRIDHKSDAYHYAATLRAYRQAGYELFKPSLVVQGYTESKSKPFGFRPVSNSLFFNASRVNARNAVQFHKLLMRHRPKIIMGYARAIAHLIKHLLDSNLKIPAVESVINYGENLRFETKEFLSKQLGCQVFDFCSQTENAMMMHSFPDGSLYLIEDYFYPEILDESGMSIEQGTGELIGTSFYNLAMPLIRYRTRDLVEIGADKLKQGFRSVTQIIGRLDDEIMLPDGGHVSLVEGALGYAEGIVAAQYVQEDRSSLKVVLVVDENFSETCFRSIEEALVKRLGDELNYEFIISDKLESNKSGKIPFIINKIPD